MFGAFKKLFSKSAQPETVGRTAQTFPTRPAFVPASVQELAPEAPMATSPQQAASKGDVIHIPLTAIVPKLPGHLARLAIRAGMGTLDLPVATALEQLPTGRVRIPFGQLRKGVPSGTFADNETHDDVMIELPLSPILTGMNPALLARKAQKRVQVPDEVLGVFGPQGSISARVAKDVASASAMPENSPAATVAPAAPPPPAPVPAARPAPAIPTVAPTPLPTARVSATPVSASPTSSVSPISAPRPTPITPVSPMSAPVAGPGPIRVPIAPKPVAPAASSNALPFAQRAEALLAQRLPAMGIKSPVPTPPPPSPVAITPISPIAPEPEVEEEVETEVEAEQIEAPVEVPTSQFAPVVMPKAPTVGDVVPVPLSDISENWPDPVRQEIAHGEWDMSMVVFPINRLETGMKSGKISFTWGEIRQWLNPPIGSVHSQHVDAPVELPLKVVAPLFLAARRPTSQRKTDFDETIPDVFTGLEPGAAVKHPPVSARPGNTEMFRNAAAAAIPAGPVRTGNTDLFKAPMAPLTPVAPAPVSIAAEPEVEEEEVEQDEEEVSTPAAVAAPAPAPPASGVPRPDPLGSIFGMPLKSDWTPAEIAQKVCELTGVSGGVITTADGLPIAGNVEEPQKVETLAAFLPQIFARLNQYAGEMEIGLLTSLNMTTAEAPCAIYKCGKLYLGVVGRFGQTLPDSHLRRIAAEIAKRNP